MLEVTDLPSVDILTVSTQKNNLVKHILERLFGAVFQHQMRGPDATLEVASHYQQTSAHITELPNYDTDEILLLHADHSHYENPVRAQDFHSVEGTSENTFLDGFAALQTLREEDPPLNDALCRAPMILGRVTQFHSPPLFKTNVDAAVRMKPGFPGQAKCIRWHPHLAVYLLSPFEEYELARRA